VIHVFLFPLAASIFLAINMGGSGIAAAFSSSYGADLIRKDLIPGLFGAFVLIGAVFSGGEVTKTIGGGIVSKEYFTIGITTIMLLSIGFSILLANTKKLFFQIIPTWFYLPIVAFVATFIIGKFIYKPIRDKELIDFSLIKDHPVIRYAVIMSSCYVAYAIGANNVANASGPILSLLNNTMKNAESDVLLILISTLLIAPWFGIGGSFFSSRVLETTGKEIIKFGPLGAFAISIITGSLLIFVSIYGGIPAALAQLNIGAILGLGVYKEGFKNTFSKRTVKRILVVWIVAPVMAFVIAYLLMSIYVGLN